MIDIFECFPIEIDDELLSKARIAAWLFDQQLETTDGKKKPFSPKAFPERAIDIIVQFGKSGKDILEIYLDPKSLQWNSKILKFGKFGKLAPEQLDQFFQTEFYKKMARKLTRKWPLSDPQYGALFQAVKQMDASSEILPEELEDLNEEVDQKNKKPQLANKDLTGDGKRDYSGSGRKIMSFSDIGVNNKSGKYFCWPRRGKEFKWNSWKNWKKIRPFCRMSFKYNERTYMLSLSLFDEEFENHGFRGADTQWTPPLAWLTHEECSQILQLSIVRKFLKQCQKKVEKYMKMTPEEVMSKIDKPERVTIKEIEKTQKVIKHVMKVVFKEKQADNYKYDTEK